jgi:hypothetical protein
MNDSNNELGLPERPNPALKRLDRLVGSWKQTGGWNGTATYEWMEGGFYLIQKYDGTTPSGRHITGMEFVGFDENSQTLRSRLFGNDGSNFVYTIELEGNSLTIWFGEKGSDNHFLGTFSEDGDTITGSWEWPGGGYDATMKRVEN